LGYQIRFIPRDDARFDAGTVEIRFFEVQGDTVRPIEKDQKNVETALTAEREVFPIDPLSGF